MSRAKIDWMAPTEDMIEAKRHLDEWGFCVLGKLLSDAQLTEMRQRIAAQAQYERDIGAAGVDDAQLTSENQYIYAIINKGRVFLDLFERDPIHDLMSHILGEDYLLSASDAAIAAPGMPVMPLHSDQWWLPAASAPPTPHVRAGSARRFNLVTSLDGRKANHPIAPPACATVIWAITDFAADNGGTRLVPGSHLSGMNPDPSVPHKIETIPVEVKAGQAVVFDGRLWHSTGANITAKPRFGILTTYCGPQFRQMENYPLVMRPEVLARVSPRLRAILGFKVWQGYGKLDRSDAALIARDDALIGAYDGDA